VTADYGSGYGLVLCKFRVDLAAEYFLMYCGTNLSATSSAVWIMNYE